MVDIQKNEQVNGKLRALYQQYAEAYLSAYRAAFHDPEPPHRINEFGIIDVKQYDGDKGILFMAKETNGWDNADYKADRLFRSWVNGIARNGLAGKGHVGRHPGMWYNLGRWAAYLNGTNRNIDQIKTYIKRGASGNWDSSFYQSEQGAGPWVVGERILGLSQCGHLRPAAKSGIGYPAP